MAAALSEAERRVGSRQMTLLMSTATIVLGIVRGALGGAFARLGEPYGITYLAALVVGVTMLGWITLPLPDGGYRVIGSRLYVAGFPVMFTLMVLMRFGG